MSDKWLLTRTQNPEQATPILGLCHGVFTDRFILRYILEHFFTRKLKVHSLKEPRIRSLRYKNGKQYVIGKNIIFRSVSYWWLVCETQKIFQICFKIVLKIINWSVETPWHEYKKFFALGYRLTLAPKVNEHRKWACDTFNPDRRSKNISAKVFSVL